MSARPPKVGNKLVAKKVNNPFGIAPELLRMFPMFQAGGILDAKRENEVSMILKTLYKNTKGTNTSISDDTQVTIFNLHDAASIKANVKRTIGMIEERIDKVTRTGGKHSLEFTITLTNLPGKPKPEAITIKIAKFPLTDADKKNHIDFIQSFFNTHLNPPAAAPAPGADAGAAAAALPAPADAGARAPAAAEAKAAADAGAAPAAGPAALLAPVPAPPAPAQGPVAGAAAADAKVAADAVAAPPAPEDRVAPPAPARRVAAAAVRFAPTPAALARPAADPATRLSAAPKSKIRF